MRAPSARRAWIWLAGGTGVAMLVALAGALPVFAVHDVGFCLQGDVQASVTCTSASRIDWKDILQGGGTYTSGSTTLSDNAVQTKSNMPLTNTNGTFIASTAAPDFAGGNATPDPTTYATGSKDTSPISTGNNPWQCAASSNVGAKVNLLNTYGTVEYATRTDWQMSTSGVPTPKATSSTHTVLYWGAEIESANGNHNQGIWLLQDKSVDCATNGTQTFSGNHVDGDLLFTVALTGGGSKPESASVLVFRWVGAATTGSMQELGGGLNIGSVCGAGTGLTDLACAKTNSGSTITTPWANTKGVPGTTGTLGPQQFFEGGIDVTAVQQLFSASTTACFTKFLTNTRSSASDTATLFDYTNARLDTCVTPTVGTQLKQQSGASQSNSDTNVTSSGVDVGSKVYDTSSLTGAINPTGTITYKLFANNNCTGEVPAASINNATLASDGTLKDIVSSGDLVSGVPPNSTTLTFTQVGTYYWVAYYGGDLINKKNDSGCAAEPLKINKLSPSLSTSATNPSSSIIVGQTVTISDGATLTGAYFGLNSAIGTMAFSLWGPVTLDGSGKATSCGTQQTLTPGASSVSVTSSTVASGDQSFTPSSMGNYYWTAAFTDTSGNNNSKTHSGCVVGATPDSTELVPVIKATPKLTTVMFVGDIATISGGYGTVTGNVTFNLYEDTAGSSTVCASDPIISYGPIALSSLTASTVADLSTHLSGYQMHSGKVYNWEVVFTDTDGSNTDVTVGCGNSNGATGSTTSEQATPTYAP